MKVVELIKQLYNIEFDENTELTFSTIDGKTGEWYELKFAQLNYGEELTGKPYNNDTIDIEVDVDSQKEYLKDKTQEQVDLIVQDLRDIVSKYC